MRFALLWPESASEISVRNCDCTFCQKHAGAWTSHREAELTADVTDLSYVSKYQFGTKTADFYVCSVCGVVPFVTCEIDDIQYAVVNVNTFEKNAALSFSSSPSNFDGEAKGSRLERRKRNWMANVRIEESGV